MVTAAAPGQALVNNGVLLETREAEFALDTSKPFKVNADTNGVCELSLPLPCVFAVHRHQLPDADHRPRVVHADAPRGYRERGREA